VTVKLALYCFLGLAVFISQLLERLFAKGIFVKELSAPLGWLVLFYELTATILTFKQLLAITGFTVFNNII
jgi:hypothetical protein